MPAGQTSGHWPAISCARRSFGSANLLDNTTAQSDARASAQTSGASTDPLQAAVTAAADPVQPGQSVTYTIKITNPLSTSSGGFTVYASVPEGTTDASSQVGGGSCTSSHSTWPCLAGQELVWGPGAYQTSLAAGASVTYPFSALMATANAPANGSILATVVTTTRGGEGEAVARGGTASTVAPPPPTSSNGDVPAPAWAEMLLALGWLAVIARAGALRGLPSRGAVQLCTRDCDTRPTLVSSNGLVSRDDGDLMVMTPRTTNGATPTP